MDTEDGKRQSAGYESKVMTARWSGATWTHAHAGARDEPDGKLAVVGSELNVGCAVDSLPFTVMTALSSTKPSPAPRPLSAAIPTVRQQTKMARL